VHSFSVAGIGNLRSIYKQFSGISNVRLRLNLNESAPMVGLPHPYAVR